MSADGGDVATVPATTASGVRMPTHDGESAGGGHGGGGGGDGAHAALPMRDMRVLQDVAYNRQFVLVMRVRGRVVMDVQKSAVPGTGAKFHVRLHEVRHAHELGPQVWRTTRIAHTTSLGWEGGGTSLLALRVVNAGHLGGWHLRPYYRLFFELRIRGECEPLCQFACDKDESDALPGLRKKLRGVLEHAHTPPPVPPPPVPPHEPVFMLLTARGELVTAAGSGAGPALCVLRGEGGACVVETVARGTVVSGVRGSVAQRGDARVEWARREGAADEHGAWVLSRGDVCLHAVRVDDDWAPELDAAHFPRARTTLWSTARSRELTAHVDGHLSPLTRHEVPARSTPLDVHALATRFAPLAWLHPDERFLPSSVEWFLERSALRNGRTGSERPVQLRDLAPLDSALDQHFALVIKRENQGDARRGVPLVGGCVSGAPVYANVVETPRGALIQYWFFFPHNGPIAIPGLSMVPVVGERAGAHDGDWEHVDVHVGSGVPGGDPSTWAVQEVYYSQHGSAKFGDYVAAPHCMDAACGRACVFIALHGHACFPSAVGRVLASADHVVAGGARWETWHDVCVVAHNGTLLAGAEWIGFAGRWGRDGPRSPTDLNWWRAASAERMPVLRNSVSPHTWRKRIHISEAFRVKGRTYMRALWWRLVAPHCASVQQRLSRDDAVFVVHGGGMDALTLRCAGQVLAWKEGDVVGELRVHTVNGEVVGRALSQGPHAWMLNVYVEVIGLGEPWK